MIKLDPNYTIDCDGNGTTLHYQDVRERLNKKTLQPETYVFKDHWYFLSVPQALSKYRDLVLEETEDLKGVLKKLGEVELLIKSIK